MINNKMTKYIIFTLIGLSLVSCDPEETFQNHLYQRIFINKYDKEMKIVYHSFGSSKTDHGATIVTDTLILPAHTKKAGNFEEEYSSEGIKEDNFKWIIEQNISVFNTINNVPKFELYLGGEFIKEWKGIAGYLGTEINSPYNYNSWEIIKYDTIHKPSHGMFIYGEILFTISKEDIE